MRFFWVPDRFGDGRPAELNCTARCLSLPYSYVMNYCVCEPISHGDHLPSCTLYVDVPHTFSTICCIPFSGCTALPPFRARCRVALCRATATFAPLSHASPFSILCHAVPQFAWFSPCTCGFAPPHTRCTCHYAYVHCCLPPLPCHHAHHTTLYLLGSTLPALPRTNGLLYAGLHAAANSMCVTPAGYAVLAELQPPTWQPAAFCLAFYKQTLTTHFQALTLGYLR